MSITTAGFPGRPPFRPSVTAMARPFTIDGTAARPWVLAAALVALTLAIAALCAARVHIRAEVQVIGKIVVTP